MQAVKKKTAQVYMYCIKISLLYIQQIKRLIKAKTRPLEILVKIMLIGNRLTKFSFETVRLRGIPTAAITIKTNKLAAVLQIYTLLLFPYLLCMRIISYKCSMIMHIT